MSISLMAFTSLMASSSSTIMRTQSWRGLCGLTTYVFRRRHRRRSPHRHSSTRRCGTRQPLRFMISSQRVGLAMAIRMQAQSQQDHLWCQFSRQRIRIRRGRSPQLRRHILRRPRWRHILPRFHRPRRPVEQQAWPPMPVELLRKALRIQMHLQPSDRGFHLHHRRCPP